MSFSYVRVTKGYQTSGKSFVGRRPPPARAKYSWLARLILFQACTLLFFESRIRAQEEPSKGASEIATNVNSALRADEQPTNAPPAPFGATHDNGIQVPVSLRPF